MKAVGSDVDTVVTALERLLPGRVRRDQPFRELTTYRLGGPAAGAVTLSSVDDLDTFSAALRGTGAPVVVVGRGSNLLVADEGFAGVAVLLGGDLAGIDIGAGHVRAGAGLELPVLARRAAAAGRAGLEFYVGIPGTVGGAARMNAGGHGTETAEVLQRVWVADLAAGAPVVERPVGALGLGYRRSGLRPSEVVVAAEFRVTPQDPARCRDRLDEVVRWRRLHQPGGSNAGSVFANPPGDSAGRLIDACGLKGFSVGGVAVSDRHANFFQAAPDARAADVVALIVEVRARVEDAVGVRLVPELRRVGFAGQPGAGPAAPSAWDGDPHVWEAR